MTRQAKRTTYDAPRQKEHPGIETGNVPVSPQAGIENAEANDFERSQEDVPIDDPGDAQRASKSEPDGDGEEELR